MSLFGIAIPTYVIFIILAVIVVLALFYIGKGFFSELKK